ncbi:MAG: Zn-ribbon domain-containing OB-fold protein [Sphaerobacter sp.]|nr:Zn-ribbon domain-containing OB-fold protein [Sphaerobacter sp.]
MSTPSKPLPVADPITAPFWESLRAHAMQLQRCDACGRFVFYPRVVCPHCGSRALTWQPVAGTGVVHAFTIVHRHPNPAFAAEIPYVVALVELDEGVRMLTNLVGVEPDPAQVRVGMPVEVVYEDVSDVVTLPQFRPRAG